MAPIGAAIRVSGGLMKTGVRETREIGAEVVQFFSGNPRGWRAPALDVADASAFRDYCGAAGIAVFIHAPYLLNVGSPDPAVLANTTAALAECLRRAALIGAAGVVLHAGSSITPEFRAEALRRLPAVLGPLLDAAPAGPRLLIEPTAGGGAALASDSASTVEYFAALDDERVGLCLDTCHLHAAGEDLSTPFRLGKVLRGLAVAVGRLDLLHVNDSQDPRGSKRDRHASLGTGFLGTGPLPGLFGSPVLRKVPVLVETPEAGAGVALLKELRAARGATR
ncbi:deoxyribonuclease IV [Nocardia asteroides]|uniref:deoxyribonuclease IV n=1 Tax=Nocardia asteroides TaxID=1824 RepID=UPI001E3A919D|nr:deoxyribonuclease IV [Nocardia asteroides]UGT59027.1 deoxyribonuclease IV [Nocardia asteroides]